MTVKSLTTNLSSQWQIDFEYLLKLKKCNIMIKLLYCKNKKKKYNYNRSSVHMIDYINQGRIFRRSICMKGEFS